MVGKSDIVGLIPAAGRAQRISPLPCSKEIFPVGFTVMPEGARPKPCCLYLLEKMRKAGVEKAYLILREGKWDIPSYLGDGSQFGMSFAYLMMGLPYGPPYTLDQAYAFVRGATVVFGFPDILFAPNDAYVRLLERLEASGADAALGLFPAAEPETMDLIETSRDGWVSAVVRKPAATHLKNAWLIAVWRPAFTEFLHAYLPTLHPDAASDPDGRRRWGKDTDLAVGDVLQAAVEEGIRVQSVLFPDSRYLDIGTPAALGRAVHDWSWCSEYPGSK